MRVYQYVNYGPSHNESWERLCQIRLWIQSLNRVNYRMHYLFIVANCQYFKTCSHIRVRNFSGTSSSKHIIITSVAGRSQYFTTHMTREQKQFNQTLDPIYIPLSQIHRQTITCLQNLKIVLSLGNDSLFTNWIGHP